VVRKSAAMRIREMAVFLLPGLIVYLVFFFIPTIQGFLFSVYSWEGYQREAFVGLRNFAKMFSDETLKASILNVVYFMAVYATVPVALGLVCAELFSRGKVKGRLAYRSIFYLPQVFNLTAVGILFRWIAHPDYGIVNSALGWLGLGALRRPWLGDPSTAIHAVALMTVWYMYGYVMVIFFSGMQKIPESLYEAAALDGANVVRQLFSITVPSLRNEFTIIIILMMINALNTYPMIAAATNGGPGYATMVPALYGFRVFGFQNNVGYGSAIINGLVVVTIVISASIYLVREKEA
jgi:raffinose/stachyose/melibiose transport system permease protein